MRFPFAQGINVSDVEDDNLDVADPPNGYYVKLKCGLALCFYETPASIEATEAAGSIYKSLTPYTWTFPVEFIEPPYVDSSADSEGRWGDSANVTTTQADIFHWCYISASATLSSRIYAIGRWKE